MYGRRSGPRPAMESFDELIDAFVGRDGVMLGGGPGFGAGTLKVDGRIFAMSSEEGVALKLPGDRVSSLIASGDGLPFDAGKGKPLREWVVVPWEGDQDVTALTEEALAFVGRRPDSR